MKIRLYLLGISSEILFEKQKTCTVFLSIYRNKIGSLGERETLWEQQQQFIYPINLLT